MPTEHPRIPLRVDGGWPYGRHMRLPDGPDLGLLLIRTDYSSQDAWHRALGAATTIYPGDDWRNGALLTPVEAPELSAVAVADEQSMRDDTILFLDLNEFGGEIGRTFRAIPREIEPITANLSLANMDFSDFADNADADGIFRGF